MKKILTTKYIKFCFVFGIGYWKDVYKKEDLGLDGEAYNIILPFIRIQWGYLITE